MAEKSWLQALVDGFVDLGLGDGKPVYPGFGPEKKPAEYTTLVPSGGISTAWPGGKLQRLTIQINSYAPAEAFGVAHERATTTHDALHERTAWELSGYRVERLQCLQPPFPNGIDDGRQCITYNALLLVRRKE